MGVAKKCGKQEKVFFLQNNIPVIIVDSLNVGVNFYNQNLLINKLEKIPICSSDTIKYDNFFNSLIKTEIKTGIFLLIDKETYEIKEHGNEIITSR